MMSTASDNNNDDVGVANNHGQPTQVAVTTAGSVAAVSGTASGTAAAPPAFASLPSSSPHPHAAATGTVLLPPSTAGLALPPPEHAVASSSGTAAAVAVASATSDVTTSAAATDATATTSSPAKKKKRSYVKRKNQQDNFVMLLQQQMSQNQNRGAVEQYETTKNFLQTIPEEHFMVWCFAVEKERQRRTKKRQAEIAMKKRSSRKKRKANADEGQKQQQDGLVVVDGQGRGDTNSAAATTQQQQQEQSSDDPQANAANPEESSVKVEEADVKVHRHELTWCQRFQELLDYRVEHGHVDVPDESIPQLSKWVQSQRQLYKHKLRGQKNALTESRLSKLQNVGFKFAIKDDFEGRYAQLLEFKSIFGHTRVPQHYTDQNKLGTWVKGQRAAYRHWQSGGSDRCKTNHCKLTPERIQRLNDIGFEWVVKKRGGGSS